MSDNFMKAQIKAIEIYKWIESEKCGCDLGNECVKKWIKENAMEFRQKWNELHDK